MVYDHSNFKNKVFNFSVIVMKQLTACLKAYLAGKNNLFWRQVCRGSSWTWPNLWYLQKNGWLNRSRI